MDLSVVKQFEEAPLVVGSIVVPARDTRMSTCGDTFTRLSADEIVKALQEMIAATDAATLATLHVSGKFVNVSDVWRHTSYRAAPATVGLLRQLAAALRQEQSGVRYRQIFGRLRDDTLPQMPGGGATERWVCAMGRLEDELGKSWVAAKVPLDLAGYIVYLNDGRRLSFAAIAAQLDLCAAEATL